MGKQTQYQEAMAYMAKLPDEVQLAVIRQLAGAKFHKVLEDGELSPTPSPFSSRSPSPLPEAASAPAAAPASKPAAAAAEAEGISSAKIHELSNYLKTLDGGGAAAADVLQQWTARCLQPKVCGNLGK